MCFSIAFAHFASKTLNHLGENFLAVQKYQLQVKWAFKVSLTSLDLSECYEISAMPFKEI